jgi:DNA gyrase subunit B
MNPKTRVLKQLIIENDYSTNDTFSLLMGDVVPPRREFIEKNAKYATVDV